MLNSRKILRTSASGVALAGLLMTAPPVGADELFPQRPPAAVKVGQLDFGLKPSWALPHNLKPCSESCSRPPVAAQFDDAHYYHRDVRVNLVRSGPMSLGLAGRRLKMEFAF